MIDILTTLAAAAPAASGGAFNGNFALGVAGAGAGIGLGLIGMAAAQAVGRNPSAFGTILTIGISEWPLQRLSRFTPSLWRFRAKP